MAGSSDFFYNKAVIELYLMQFVINSVRKEKIHNENKRLSENQR